MKHNYINRIACAILLSFFACVIVHAEPKVSRINADIHYTDGNIVYVENLDLPYGNIFSKAVSTETEMFQNPHPHPHGRAFPEWLPSGKFPRKACKLLMLS